LKLKLKLQFPQFTPVLDTHEPVSFAPVHDRRIDSGYILSQKRTPAPLAVAAF
jgi:hypothetical protein